MCMYSRPLPDLGTADDRTLSCIAFCTMWHVYVLRVRHLWSDASTIRQKLYLSPLVTCTLLHTLWPSVLTAGTDMLPGVIDIPCVWNTNVKIILTFMCLRRSYISYELGSHTAHFVTSHNDKKKSIKCGSFNYSVVLNAHRVTSMADTDIDTVRKNDSVL
jgi:hypothetical protein